MFDLYNSLWVFHKYMFRLFDAHARYMPAVYRSRDCCPSIKTGLHLLLLPSVTVAWWNRRALGMELVASSSPGRVGYISHVHNSFDHSGPFGVLWVHMDWYKNCAEIYRNSYDEIKRFGSITKHSQTTTKDAVVEHFTTNPMVLAIMKTFNNADIIQVVSL